MRFALVALFMTEAVIFGISAVPSLVALAVMGGLLGLVTLPQVSTMGSLYRAKELPPRDGQNKNVRAWNPATRACDRN